MVIDMELELAWWLFWIMPYMVLAVVSWVKADIIVNKLRNFKFGVDSCYALEVAEYDPKKDKLAIFIGDNEIPPKDVFDDIKESLDELPNKNCHLLIAPGIFRIVVLKGKK